jgi:hypothetical protein
VQPVQGIDLPQDGNAVLQRNIDVVGPAAIVIAEDVVRAEVVVRQRLAAVVVGREGYDDRKLEGLECWVWRREET